MQVFMMGLSPAHDWACSQQIIHDINDYFISNPTCTICCIVYMPAFSKDMKRYRGKQLHDCTIPWPGTWGSTHHWSHYIVRMDQLVHHTQSSSGHLVSDRLRVTYFHRTRIVYVSAIVKSLTKEESTNAKSIKSKYNLSLNDSVALAISSTVCQYKHRNY